MIVANEQSICSTVLMVFEQLRSCCTPFG